MIETTVCNNVGTATDWDCCSLVRPGGGSVDLTVTKPEMRGRIRVGDEVDIEVEGNTVRFHAHRIPGPKFTKPVEPEPVDLGVIKEPVEAVTSRHRKVKA